MMMSLPPSFSRDDFDRLASLGSTQVEQRYRRDADRLHAFLNEAPETRIIQPARREWTRPKYDEPFGNFNAEDRHWYTFNVGGRNEAQLNVGMYGAEVGPKYPSGYLRVGIAFEMSRREGGDPDRVWGAYAGFAEELRNNREKWQAEISGGDYWVETARAGALIQIPPAETLSWLLEPPPTTEWIFLGRLLDPEHDTNVLADSHLLGDAVRRVFANLIPLWRTSMRRAKALGLT